MQNYWLLSIVSLLAACASAQDASVDQPPPGPNSLRVCVVERDPFSKCAIASPDNWTPSYFVTLFREILSAVEDTTVRDAIRSDWQCVGKSTADLILELSRPVENRGCDIVIAPITITEERRQNISFVSGVYYTYAIPVSSAQDQGVGEEVGFWLKPFQTSAWLLNFGLMIAMGVAGGILAMYLNKFFGKASESIDEERGILHDFAVKSVGSFASVFGQHPSHGVFATHNEQNKERTRGIDFILALFFVSGVFALGIVSMQYAGNLAAIQSRPTVIPAFDSIADLYGQKVLTNTLYGSQLDYNVTTVPPTISNNGDVVEAIKQVDSGKVDAFVWDAPIVLYAMSQVAATKENVCVWTLKKRVFPFELGFGVGKDISPQVVNALQQGLQSLDDAGRKRELRNTYLEAYNKYIGRPVCPSAAQGLTPGQTAGVYVVPAIVLGGILVGSLIMLAYRKCWKKSELESRTPTSVYEEPSMAKYPPYNYN